MPVVTGHWEKKPKILRSNFNATWDNSSGGQHQHASNSHQSTRKRQAAEERRVVVSLWSSRVPAHGLGVKRADAQTQTWRFYAKREKQRDTTPRKINR